MQGAPRKGACPWPRVTGDKLNSVDQLAVRPEERMGSVEISDRNLMGHDGSEAVPRKPGMEMKGWRLDLE